MRANYSPPGGRRSSSSTPILLGLALLVLVLGLAGLMAAVLLINRAPDPLEIDPAATGIPIQASAAPDSEGTPAVESPGEELPPGKTGQGTRTYGFEYRCQSYAVSLPVYASLYDYYASQDKSYYFQGSLPADWQADYYLKFLESDYDQELITSLVSAVAGSLNTTEEELVIALTSLVQNLTYDCEKLFSYQFQEGEGFATNFPYETLYLQEGVCGDSSILLAKILEEVGFGTAFLVYEANNHMALGIQCPGGAATYRKNGIGYCYIETTAPSRIGVKPNKLSGEDFNEEPLIIPISEGKSFDRMVSLAEELERDVLTYGGLIRQLATCQEISLYQDIISRETNLDLQRSGIEGLKNPLAAAELDYQQELQYYESLGCQGSVPQEKYDQCVAQETVVNQKIDLYNGLVEEYNQLLEEYRSNYDQYASQFEAYQTLLESTRQGCAVVSADSLEKQEEVDAVAQ